MAGLGRAASGNALVPHMYDLPQRLAWMDERNVKMHVLTLSGQAPWQWASQEIANKLARIVNDAAIERTRRFRIVSSPASRFRCATPGPDCVSSTALPVSLAYARFICPIPSRAEITFSSRNRADHRAL